MCKYESVDLRISYFMFNISYICISTAEYDNNNNTEFRNMYHTTYKARINQEPRQYAWVCLKFEMFADLKKFLERKREGEGRCLVK